jgi:hypothetical protein
MRQPEMRRSGTKDELAKKYGFESYAALLAASTLVPDNSVRGKSDEALRSYVALDPNGRWFVWNDENSLEEDRLAEPPPMQEAEN